MGILKKKSKRINENTEIDYRKNKIKYVQILGFWVKTVIKSKRKFAYFNIFEFDKNLNNPKQWFEASLFLYDCLLFLLEGSEYDSFLSVPLSNSDKATNIEAINYAYLKFE